MDIIIKNVTGCPGNDWMIWELGRVGFPSGSIVRDVYFNPVNKSCSWSSGTDDCVAWLGETCIKMPRISKIHSFSLKDGGMGIDAVINGKKVGPVKMSREDVITYSDKTDHRALVIKYLIIPNLLLIID